MRSRKLKQPLPSRTRWLFVSSSRSTPCISSSLPLLFSLICLTMESKTKAIKSNLSQVNHRLLQNPTNLSIPTSSSSQVTTEQCLVGITMALLVAPVETFVTSSTLKASQAWSYLVMCFRTTETKTCGLTS